MAKPAILVVDDDAEVLRALDRDLRHKYGSTYRIVRSTSADAALDVLRQLKLRNESVALMLSHQRMPRVTSSSLAVLVAVLHPVP